jgi:hypothetical protein
MFKFDAARDLVFTNSADGNTITSGGYRISKMFGGVKRKQKGGKKKNKKEHKDDSEDYNDEMENLYKEESGIPMGLLFVGPNFRVQRGEHVGNADHASNDTTSHHDDNTRIAGIGELELIMPNLNPQQSSSQIMIIGDDNACELKEDAREINSKEVDAELFQILLDNALIDHSNENAAPSRKITRKQRINLVNNNNNDVNLRNLKVDKIYIRRKTRRHNN